MLCCESHVAKGLLGIDYFPLQSEIHFLPGLHIKHERLVCALCNADMHQTDRKPRHLLGGRLVEKLKQRNQPCSLCSLLVDTVRMFSAS